MKKLAMPQYGMTIYFTLDWTEIKNKRVRWKFQRDTEDDDADGVCHQDKEGGIYIWINPNEDMDFISLIDIVAHEVFHAVGFIYKYIGDKTQIRDTEESPAYYQGWITGEIVRAMGYK